LRRTGQRRQHERMARAQERGMMEIEKIALELNKLSRSHPIGHLQELRARLRGKPSRTRAIFTESTIFPDYAFHDGGRHELQFNIGTEKIKGREVFRYGVAFSLETSRAHPDISGLFPKVERFNYYLRTNPEAFPGFLMWYWSVTRGEDFYPQPSTQIGQRRAISYSLENGLALAC
jgi:hypothetical protein